MYTLIASTHELWYFLLVRSLYSPFELISGTSNAKSMPMIRGKRMGATVITGYWPNDSGPDVGVFFVVGRTGRHKFMGPVFPPCPF